MVRPETALRFAVHDLPVSDAPPRVPRGLSGAPSDSVVVQFRSVRRGPLRPPPEPALDLYLTKGAFGVLGSPLERREFAYLASGLIEPSVGFVTIDGLPPSSLTEVDRKRWIGGVMAGAQPLQMSILENLRLRNPLCSPEEAACACHAAGLGDWLSKLPLGVLSSASGDAYSTTTARLPCLARLLVNPPRVLTLDGTLDELSTEEARQLARELSQLAEVVLLGTSRPEILPSGYHVVDLRSHGAHAVSG